jgi:hypothetical protein
MGLVLAAKCPCGVEGQVFAGSGMTEGSACLPAWCSTCQRLVTAPVQQGDPHCEQCRALVKPIHLYEPTGLREIVPEEPVACPRCGEQSLRFEFDGVWD